jgi:ornithine--oxo-acid transaminase
MSMKTDVQNSAYYMQLDEEYGAHNYHPIPVVISRAEGVWVWDPEGRKYMDCLSAYSAVNQGHRHPRVIAALKEQVERVTLTSRAFHNDRLGPFLKKLTEVTQMEMALPMNTGAEAVETAIKIARKWGYEKKGVPDGKAEIIVCEENFHGRTTTIVGFSTDPGARDGFGPATPGFKIIPYNDVKALEKAITPHTVGFLVEPIQGEAGVKVPAPGYLKEVQAVCRRHNVLLMVDEIQTGFCRTGKMFAWMHSGAKPDILMVGKALGGGVYPVSAALASRDVMMVIGPGQHGSTFGGNPLACAVATAALDILIDEKLDHKSDALGNRFREGLRALRSNKMKEIRGMGLLNAIELTPGVGKARQYTEKLKSLGVLAKETHEVTIRFAPPLVISESEVDWLVGKIGEAFA